MTGRVGVIGGGTMGIGIAYVFAAAGSPVTLVEPDVAQADRARDVLAEQAAKAKSKGKLDAEAADALPSKVSLASSVEELESGLDLIVEAVPERLELKQSVLASAAARAPRLLGTNTSGLSIDSLAAGLPSPETFLGLHFFNPVWSMPLVEIIRGGKTSAQTLTTARDAVSRIGKESIVVADAPGFATSRLGIAIGLEAMRMLEDGVAAAPDIDRAMELGTGTRWVRCDCPIWSGWTCGWTSRATWRRPTARVSSRRGSWWTRSRQASWARSPARASTTGPDS